MEDSIISRIVQIGTVTDIDAGALKARVLFRESNMSSGWLSVVQHDGAGVTVKESGKHTHEISEGTCEEAGAHTHLASVGTWMPKINDIVLCLYPPVRNSDGYIIGRCP